MWHSIASIRPLVLFRIADAYTKALEGNKDATGSPSGSHQVPGDTIARGILLGTRQVKTLETPGDAQETNDLEAASEWKVELALECALLTPHAVEHACELSRAGHPNLTLIGWYSVKSQLWTGETTVSDAQQLSIEAAIIHHFQEEALWLEICLPAQAIANDHQAVPQLQAWFVRPRARHEEIHKPRSAIAKGPCSQRSWEELLASLSIHAVPVAVDASEAERCVLETLGDPSFVTQTAGIVSNTQTSFDETCCTHSNRDADDQTGEDTQTRSIEEICVSSNLSSPDACRMTRRYSRASGVETCAERVSIMSGYHAGISRAETVTPDDALTTAVAYALRSVQDATAGKRLYAQLCSIHQATIMLLDAVRVSRKILDTMSYRFASCQSAEDEMMLSESEASLWARLQSCLGDLLCDEPADSSRGTGAAFCSLSENVDVGVAIEGLSREVANLVTLYKDLSMHRAPAPPR
jgi:hypothetical protein